MNYGIFHKVWYIGNWISHQLLSRCWHESVECLCTCTKILTMRWDCPNCSAMFLWSRFSIVAHNPSSICMTITFTLNLLPILTTWKKLSFMTISASVRRVCLDFYKLSMFNQFLHPQQYLPQQVPFIATFFAQSVNSASINQLEGVGSDYWLL